MLMKMMKWGFRLTIAYKCKWILNLQKISKNFIKNFFLIKKEKFICFQIIFQNYIPNNKIIFSKGIELKLVENRNQLH